MRTTLAECEDLENIIAMPGFEERSERDRAIARRARRLERFLTRPFFSALAPTGNPGCLVAHSDTPDGREAILADELPGATKATST